VRSRTGRLDPPYGGLPERGAKGCAARPAAEGHAEKENRLERGPLDAAVPKPPELCAGQLDASRVLDDPAADGGRERRLRAIRSDFPLEQQRRREFARRGRRRVLRAAGEPGEHAFDRRVQVGGGSRPEKTFARAVEELAPPGRVAILRSEDQGKERFPPQELAFRERTEARTGKEGSERARRRPRAGSRPRDDGDVSGDVFPSHDRFKLSAAFGRITEIG